MFSKKSRLTYLNTERQILLAESDLNRIHLLEDLKQLQSEWQQVSQVAKTAFSVTSTVAKAGAFVLFARRLLRGFKAGAGTEPGKNSFMAKVFKGISTGLSFLETFRSRQ